jgi:hypothetical protein
LRRRIFLAALALGGTSAALIVGIAPAIGKQRTPPHIMQVECKLTLTTEPPKGSNAVSPPEQNGIQDGGVLCHNAKLGLGAIREHFTMVASGNTVGDFTEYFDTGTVAGKLTLVPQGGSFGGGSFQAQNYGGRFTISFGTGAFHGFKSTQPGTFYCTSPDSIHLSCRQRMTVLVPSS